MRVAILQSANNEIRNGFTQVSKGGVACHANDYEERLGRELVAWSSSEGSCIGGG